jgi:hypothetical protein
MAELLRCDRRLDSCHDGRRLYARRMRVDMTWREFWDRDRTTYVSERHRQLESQLIGHAVETFIPNRTAVILDYGCGDNHVADEVALSCRKLIFCDSAPLLLERLKQRYSQNQKISITTPSELHALQSGSVELIFVNSDLIRGTRALYPHCEGSRLGDRHTICCTAPSGSGSSKWQKNAPNVALPPFWPPM